MLSSRSALCHYNIWADLPIKYVSILRGKSWRKVSQLNIKRKQSEPAARVVGLSDARENISPDQTVPAAFGTPLKCTLISESSPWTRTTFSPSVRVCWPAECLCGEVGGHWGPAVITVVVADVLWNGKGPHIQASVVSIRVLPLLKGQDLFTHNRRLRPCKRPQVESPMKASGFVFR